MRLGPHLGQKGTNHNPLYFSLDSQCNKLTSLLKIKLIALKLRRIAILFTRSILKPIIINILQSKNIIHLP
jgi:hypothetical protein